MHKRLLWLGMLAAILLASLMAAASCENDGSTGQNLLDGDRDSTDTELAPQGDEDLYDLDKTEISDLPEIVDEEEWAHEEDDADIDHAENEENDAFENEEEREEEESLCPETWEGPAPPDCQRYDCDLLPYPDCWDCQLLPDLFQEGFSCSCTGGESICFCRMGECLPQSGGDEDGEAEEEIEENEIISDDSTIDSIVLAGDSWSSGFILSVQTLLNETGHADVELRYEETAIPGSRAAQWADNEDNKLTKLAAALDRPPVAEVLLLVIGGNDINFEIVGHDFDQRGEWWRNLVLDGIRDDIRTIVDFALQGRPHLHVVLIGYDYIHYEFLKAAYGLGDWSTRPYNETFVSLGERKLALANTNENVHYAHNYGIMQWTFGDTVHLPFLLPPIAYDPHVVPKPGTSPNYIPMPGGTVEVPGPLDHLPDGIHPTAEGFYTIMEHSFSQGVLQLIEGDPWP